jgi:hypothetical protein
MSTVSPRSRSRLVTIVGLVATVLTGCTASSLVTATDTASPDGAVVAEVASYQLVANQPGRLLLALLSGDGRWLSFGTVRLSYAFLGQGSDAPPPDISLADSTARFLAIPGSPEGDGRPATLTLPADGHGVYAVEPITFPHAGYWQAVAHGRLPDGSAFDAQAAFTVLDAPLVVGVGALAPRSDTPVIGHTAVPPVAIDSRAVGGQPIPDPELHAVSIADSIAAGHPALVVFSTPVYCVSRFCGPITDLVAELAGEYGDRADFIHVEIYRDFQAGTVNQAALDWLSTPSGDLREPWTFLIGADGRIAGSWDTLVTRGELEPLLKALPVRAPGSTPGAAP